jgi:catechol 2,3-dioxygenase-like lactoylglutathione lyase family enzyme
MPEITGIAHVELSVSDLDASVAWYSRLLDAPEVFRAADENERIVAAAIREPKSGIVLAFTQHRDQEGGPFTARRVGLDHLSFAVAGEAELEAWRDHLDALGIAHSPLRDYGYGLAITLSDPDGIALEFMFPVRRGQQA